MCVASRVSTHTRKIREAARTNVPENERRQNRGESRDERQRSRKKLPNHRTRLYTMAEPQSRAHPTEGNTRERSHTLERAHQHIPNAHLGKQARRRGPQGGRGPCRRFRRATVLRPTSSPGVASCGPRTGTQGRKLAATSREKAQSKGRTSARTILYEVAKWQTIETKTTPKFISQRRANIRRGTSKQGKAFVGRYLYTAWSAL